MKTTVSAAVLLGAAALFATCTALNAAEPPPAAPAAGSPGTYVDHAVVETAIAAAIAAGKDPASTQIVVTDQYSMTAVRRMKPVAPPAIHPGSTEIHFVLEGSGTFVTGGKIVTPAGAKTPVVEGGVSRKIVKGDTIIVPANSPHWYQDVDPTFRAIEVRFPAPVAAAAK